MVEMELPGKRRRERPEMYGCNERGYEDGWCKSRGDTRFGLRLKQMVICESCKELIG